MYLRKNMITKSIPKTIMKLHTDKKSRMIWETSTPMEIKNQVLTVAWYSFILWPQGHQWTFLGLSFLRCKQAD